MDRTVSATDEAMLLDRLRRGEDDAFGELFELHVTSVRRLARGIARDGTEAEDITAETFFRVLQAVRRGNGPKDNVRAYLLTVARRVTWEWHGARRDVPVSDDELTTRAGAGADTQSSTAEASLITRAFSSLPERWRTVLWQTEVEGVQPANAAPEFGLSPNATAALARRARIGLRAAYLQAHLATGRSNNGCRTVVEKLGGYTAGSITGAEARKVKAHLAACSSCRGTHDELRDVCSSLRSHAGVLALLVPAAGFVANWGGAVSGAVPPVAGSAAGAGGSTAGAVSGTTGGLAALGGPVKVGLAIASTVAVGAAGVASVAGLPEGDQHQVMGLHGGPRGDLQLVEPGPTEPQVDRRADRDGGSEREDVEQPKDAAEPDAGGRGGESARGSMPDTDYTVPAAEGRNVPGAQHSPKTEHSPKTGHSRQTEHSPKSQHSPKARHEPAKQPSRRAAQPEPGADRGPESRNSERAEAAGGSGPNARSDRAVGNTVRLDLRVGGSDDRGGERPRDDDPARQRAVRQDDSVRKDRSVWQDKASAAKQLARAWAAEIHEARRDRGNGHERPTERRSDHGASDPASNPPEFAPRLDRDKERAGSPDHRFPHAGPDHQGRKPAGAYFRGE